jgi:hypothetical protein
MRPLLAALVVAAGLAVPAGASAAPIIDYGCSPAPTSCSGWARQPVTITWSIVGTKAAGTCVDTTVAAETAGSPQYCKVTQGNVTTETTVLLMLDMTPPRITGAKPSRPPDHDGWYRKPVAVSFSGTDALSGLAGCSSTTYSSPTAGPVNLVGRCQDRAGNVSSPLTFGLRYDAVPPALAGVRVFPADRTVRVRWNIPGGASVKVWRSRAGRRHRIDSAAKGTGTVLDRGVRNGRRYMYRLTATDQAGNTATRKFTVVPGPRLIAPAASARLAGAPVLRWTRVRGADYYNVQLFRGRHKVLSAWPSSPKLRLARAWHFDGRRHRLERGRQYRWFVWPGHGSRAVSDYGPLVGTRTFSLRAP